MLKWIHHPVAAALASDVSNSAARNPADQEALKLLPPSSHFSLKRTSVGAALVGAARNGFHLLPLQHLHPGVNTKTPSDSKFCLLWAHVNSMILPHEGFWWSGQAIARSVQNVARVVPMVIYPKTAHLKRDHPLAGCL